MAPRTHIYFASDMHFGAPNPVQSRKRERHFIRWLESIEEEVAELYLLGDLFDFWFEYKHAVPKGGVRLLGKLALMADQGVKVHVFTGNHDLWYRDYLTEEFGAQVYREPVIREFFGQTYYFAHGDGLGPGDHGYKLMKQVFTHPLAKWLFHRLHPNFGIWLARFASGLSKHHDYEDIFAPETVHMGDKEFLYCHAREVLTTQPDIDYFIFGHRHILIDDEIAPGTRLFLLGDWIQYFSFLKITPEGPELGVFPVEEMREASG